MNALLCLAPLIAGLASARLEPVELQRHGEPVPMLQNTDKIAVGCDQDTLKTVVGALRARGFAVQTVVPAGNTHIISFAGEKSLSRALHIAVQEGGARFASPVFFSGRSTTVASGKIWIYGGLSRQMADRFALRSVELLRAGRTITVVEPRQAVDNIVALASQLVAAGVDAWPEMQRRYDLLLTPTDTYYNLQWSLDSTGQNVTLAGDGAAMEGLVRADVRAQDAWDISTGGVPVAVIDSGVDCEHDEFAGGCLPGINAITEQSGAAPPTLEEDPRGGHGTAVSGIVAAAMDGQGVVGLCPGCSIIPVRLIDEATFLTDAMMLRAFTHAVDEGAYVINCSFGPAPAGFFAPISAGELEGLQYAAAGRDGLGVLVVYAAGNENQSTSLYGHLQTGLDNVIAVAASNHLDMRSEYSNFGDQVDVAAPSNAIWRSPAIYSTERVGAGDVAGDYTSSFGGTSASAPIVSALAGLLLGEFPDLSAAQVAELIRLSADKVDPTGGGYSSAGRSLLYGHGRVNAHRALLLAQGQNDRPWCDTPVSDDLCDSHRDDDCDGYIDDGCPVTPVGQLCAEATECGTEAFWLCPDTGKQRDMCTWDCTEKPCSSGSTCIQGQCSATCFEAADCETGFACSDEVFGICLPECQDSSQCAPEERCDPDHSICVFDTDGAVGSPCSSDECVGSQPLCLGEMMGFPNGYCTHACSTDQDCEGAAYCIAIMNRGSFCYKGCSFDGDCRPDYICEQSGPRAGTCYRQCDRDGQCTGDDPEQWPTVVCNLDNGRCIDTAAEADAGTPDTGTPDAGSAADSASPGDDDDDDDSEDSCGCTASPGMSWALALPALLVFLRRRSR